MSLEEASNLYAEVRAWIAQQEAYQAATRKPARLTNAQRKALEALRVPLTTSPPPEIGDVDYISLLNRYRQANPADNEIDWVEEQATSRAVGGAIGRICRVIIDESRGHSEDPVESFPAEGYGLENGLPPVFPRKKEAKQYAAKCAVEWLIAHSFMPSNLKDVTFPKGRVLPSLSSSFVKPSTEGSNGALTPPAQKRQSPPKETTSDVTDFNDDGLAATKRVATLCPQLGLRPPRYVISVSASGADGCYDGYPEFGHDNSSVPRGLGHVKNVEGQEKARQEVASLVLDHLLPLQKERQALLDSMSVAPPED
ncbi:hypothetical protein VP1G_09297 [Cytospora mali]|uniref:Uncharacterized protein n=1 Tax=Cytospora mali TaxID=578113 RepID=A0A194VEE6_CYTMA|nr:hypothetical protein VP1G_09297 [Valsa mali var. pyri (nom. inval.)]